MHDPWSLWGARLAALWALALTLMVWRGVASLARSKTMAACPECGRVGPSRGLRLHVALAHRAAKADASADASPPEPPCPADPSGKGEHDWRDLDQFNPRERAAARKGWLEVCTRCETLWRG